MVYVVSDLHGYPVERFQRVLEHIEFSKDDRMYVLGDCIDRNTDGPKLIRFIMQTPNITLIKGNHEAMLLKNRHLFDGERIPCVCDLKGEKRQNYALWVSNGGYATMDAMQQYTDAQIQYMLDFLEKAPLYKEIQVGDKTYVLCHSGLGNFEPDKPLCEYSEYDLLWNRPCIEDRYYEDGTMVVFGHTPTVIYGTKFQGRPLFTDTWIDIDTGAGKGLFPLVLRLDDMKEFYF